MNSCTLIYLFRMSLRRWRTCSLMRPKQELPASPAMQQHPMKGKTRQRRRKTSMSRSGQRRPKRKWRAWRHRRRSRKERRQGKRVMQESAGSEIGGPGRKRRCSEKGIAWRELEESETEGKRRRGNEPRWTERAQILSDHLPSLRKPLKMKSRAAPAMTPRGWDKKQPFISNLCFPRL